MKNKDIIEKIIAMRDPGSMIFKDLKYLQFVITGMNTDGDLAKRVGYCVQIRKKRGQFGSDMVFLRHADGRLTTHENQSYYAMTPQQEALARQIFDILPEDEEIEKGYMCVDKVHEVGFVIENSASKPSPDTPFSITIMGK